MLGPQRTHCATNCDLMNTMQLCTKDAECPVLVPFEGAKPIPMKCVPASGDPELRLALPPGTAFCRTP
jgi:hypothetical protein